MPASQADIQAAVQRLEGLEGAPNLQQNYGQAQQAQQPLEPPSPGPPHPAEIRPTSFAKTLDGNYQPPANDQSHQQGQGSQMVEQDRPEPEPSNTTPEAEAVKRSQFNAAWTNEQTRAAERQQEIIAAAERAAAIEAQHDQEQGRDQGMGMG